MQKKTYNVWEVAELMGVSKSLVYSLIKKNKLPYIKLGEKRIVIPKEALEKVMSEVKNN